MDQPTPPSSTAIATRRIDLELGMADDTIALLLSGCCTRAIVGGLRFGDAILPEVRRHAAGTDVSVDALPGLDDGMSDLLFERRAHA
jgi:hypothetical protein